MPGRITCICFATIIGVGGFFSFTAARDDEPDQVFSDVTMDLGIVVSDLNASVEFYADVVGLQQTGGFSVDDEFCRKAGLTDGHPLKITVLTPNGDSSGTNVKLMQLPNVDSQPIDNAFIHSQLGFSYLTFFVNDIDAFLERVRIHGAKLASREPVALGGQTRLAVVRDPDGNLVEVIGKTSR
jgi:catechol 2,3-dioxygenase-like lactoylglutathione lyase family enzyme